MLLLQNSEVHVVACCRVNYVNTLRKLIGMSVFPETTLICNLTHQHSNRFHTLRSHVNVYVWYHMRHYTHLYVTWRGIDRR